jgi:hypothetical protein
MQLMVLIFEPSYFDLGSWFAEASNNHKTDDARTADIDKHNYGVDISFPVHHHQISEHSDPLTAELKRQLYKDFMKGCETKYSSKANACRYNERDRIDMNLNQPGSMFVSAFCAYYLRCS